MTITGIKTNVQAILTGSDLFVSVLPHPPSEDYNFTGFPSVSHYYNSTESDYATVTQNHRTIEYIVEMVLVVPSTVTPTAEFAQAYALMDSVIQIFDETEDLSDSGLGLAPACMTVRPAPGDLARVTTPEGEGLSMTVRLFCRDDVAFKS